MSEELYNGIVLPAEWPPKGSSDETNEQMPVPYLDSPPEHIPVDVGRQLFIDDFLIQDTTMQRVFHQPEKHLGNPIVTPERDYEGSSVYLVGEPVLWDAREQLFKMWYSPAHWVAPRALLLSEHGLSWRRPELDAMPPTNIVMPHHERFAMCSILLDYKESDEATRFKAYGWESRTDESHFNVFLSSPDGIYWREEGRWSDTFSLDTTNVFFNPFRNKWVFNPKLRGHKGRSRGYSEVDSFEGLVNGNAVRDSVVPWLRSDKRDDGSDQLEQTSIAQIYDLFATPYESIMIGAINVWYGPENDVCKEKQIPKLLQIQMGYSRDGFHWHRPVREPFIHAVRNAGPGHPEFGYLRPAGNVLNVVDDRLFFYYMAASGIDRDGRRGVYTGITINLATLRRDGFASVRAGEEEKVLVTRPVTFNGRYLFINAAIRKGGALRAELLDRRARAIAPFALNQSVPFNGDRTCVRLEWKHGNDLSALVGRPVRIRFTLTDGDLFAFWVSGSASGESGGYVGGGGPKFPGDRDVRIK